jgi:hypothetical protein
MDIIIKDLCYVDVFANKSRKKCITHTRTHATNADDHTSHAENKNRSSFLVLIFLFEYVRIKEKGVII